MTTGDQQDIPELLFAARILHLMSAVGHMLCGVVWRGVFRAPSPLLAPHASCALVLGPVLVPCVKVAFAVLGLLSPEAFLYLPRSSGGIWVRFAWVSAPLGSA